MEKLKQNVSEDQLTISRSNIQCSTSRRKCSVLDAIPIDLLIELFFRIPTKSIARFRCVWKFWSSLLRGPDFTERFMTMYLTRPQLLFAFQRANKLFFFSSPQPQNPDENSSLVVVDQLAYFPAGLSSLICRPVNGLVCLEESRRTVICNVTTGESLTLPKVTTERTHSRRYFGYDPIGKLFKVLRITWFLTNLYNWSKDCRVLTLEKGKQRWRKIELGISHSHYPLFDGICINGVLYYPAASQPFSWASMIVCFNVSSEKFRIINQEMGITRGSNLINYNGKLGVFPSIGVNSDTTSILLWILEDAEKHIWSKNTYEFPSWVWKFDSDLYFVGVTSTGEIVLSPYFVFDPFYVFYYNPKMNTIQRVQIRGIQGFEFQKVHTFIDFVGNMAPIQVLRSS